MPNASTAPSDDAMTALCPTKLGVESMERSRKWLDALLDSLTPEQFFARPAGTKNHAMYVIGHLAIADRGFLEMIGGPKDLDAVPEKWDAIFNFKMETVSDDPKDYPPIDDVRAAAKAIREKLIARFKEMTPEELAAPFGEDFQVFASCPAAMMASIAYHEGFHSGQVATVRAGLGLPPLMM